MSASAVPSILIVNDSPLLISVITAVLKTEALFQQINSVTNGEEAIQYLHQNRVDMVLMDLHMPTMGGFDATRKIVQQWPKLSILIVTATVRLNMDLIFKTLNAGAIDYVRAPSLPFRSGQSVSKVQLQQHGSRLLHKVKVLIHIKRNLFKEKIQEKAQKRVKETVSLSPPTRCLNASAKTLSHCQRMLAIGSSTGGPRTLLTLLRAWRVAPPCPVIISQHFDPGFDGEFSQWLERESGLTTCLAKHHIIPENGMIYIAAAGKNIAISSGRRILIESPPIGQHYTPNIDYLFYSMAKQLGKNAATIVLTGMGNDGETGSKAIQDAGGYALAQNSATSVIDSMPQHVRRICDISGHPPEQLAILAQQWVQR